MAPRAAIFSALFLLGCFPPGEGVDPPNGQVYFPVGLAIDEKLKFLYIVNSDFDLQFNAGTVQSWDLDALRRLVPRYCESDADCACPTGDDGAVLPGCDEEKTVCDLFDRDIPVGEPGGPPDNEHKVQNDYFGESAPSHWCVKPSPSDDVPDDELSTPCWPRTNQSNREQSLYPGRCKFISQFLDYGGAPILPRGSDGNVLHGRSVKIGAFATDVVRRTLVLPPGWTRTPLPDMDEEDTRPTDRLFIPVRGDATLHWIDIQDGELICGQDGNDGACNDRHRSGNDPDAENTRNSGKLAPEPFGIDADENGLTVMVSNQTSGAVSLFSTPRKDVDADGNPVSNIAWEEGPRYVFQESGLPARPIGIASLPMPLALPSSGRDRLPGYLVSFRNQASIFLLRVYDDAVADPARPYTRRYESVPITTNSSGVDSRGMGIDSFKRKAEEQACVERYGIQNGCERNPTAAGCEAALDSKFQACLTDAAAVSLEVFIANRAPSSLILGRSTTINSDSVTNDLPGLFTSLPLDVGPSRVYVGAIVNAEGKRERRIFTTCFDSRRISIYDPEQQRVETEIVTGRGPQAMAFDIGEDHAFAYVGHFLDSYIGVVDLDQRHRGQYGAIIATMGDPVPPRASK